MNLYQFVLAFADEHWFLSFLIIFGTVNFCCWPFQLVNRWIRSRNIKNAGWPPTHLNADGEQKKDEA